MKVVCKTNLDLNHEVWPKELPAVPNVGDTIQSATVWEDNFQLQLEVCSVTWKKALDCEIWYPEIELHIRKVFNRGISAFYEWYAPKVGKSVGNFI